MNRKEAMSQNEQADRLAALGFSYEEAESLRRISMTLRRWYERECNEDIQRDDDGKTYVSYHTPGYKTQSSVRIPDRETGARKRLAKIIDERNKRNGVGLGEMPVNAYVQTDPRGAALYIIRPGDVPDGEDVSAYYSRGICVY